jgi:sterol desaturase/sphingolipid hydroxylase (fatty acid hydroxylase superfamily)
LEISLTELLAADRASLIELFVQSWRTLMFDATGRLSPFCWVIMLLICFALYLRRRPEAGFWRWVFPRQAYSGPSFWLDVKLLVLAEFLIVLGFFAAVGFAPAITVTLQNILAGDSAPVSTWNPILVAAILFLVTDFNTYWVHRISHQWSRLWPFHAVHHSAEQLNPFTVGRKHPVYILIASFSKSILIGVTQGLLLGLLIGKIEATTILGVNLFYYVFNVTGANLRHTHIWLSYGPVIEHILISPAQHQVHHSIDPTHYNKNFGEVLAIWDWMSGSLYIPAGREELVFGLADGTGKPVPQIHGTLTDALVEPFKTAFFTRN